MNVNRNKIALFVLLIIPLLVFLSACKRSSVSDSVADLGEWLIPKDEVRDGGPGKDGIPALTDPGFIPVSQVNFLALFDLVIGVRIGDNIWAFPHRILDRHEIVNVLNVTTSYILSYCPLTGTGMAWHTRSDAGDKSFGVSGLLYNSNLILYDRDSDSYWSQMLMKAVSGPRIRQEAEMIHVIETTWETWQKLYPNSMVLSNQTGFTGAYNVYPYGDYKTSQGLLFPVANTDQRLHPKERVHGVIVGDQTKTYVISSFTGDIQVLNENFNGVDLVVVANAGLNIAASFERMLTDGTVLNFAPVKDALPVIMEDGEGNRWDIFGRAVSGPRTGSQLTPTLSYNAYWFAWAAFFPGADIHGQ
jgi:hypothetical protein